MSHCPCGSQKKYVHCCGVYIEHQEKAKTPEQLMRSRYTAYSLAKIGYIKETMQGKPLSHFNEQEAKKWAEQAFWLGLEVLSSSMENENCGFVEFRARFMEHNQLKTIHELSEFHQEDGYWFYVDGVNKLSPNKKHQTTVARNSICPCGSGRKFKNCHAQ